MRWDATLLERVCVLLGALSAAIAFVAEAQRAGAGAVPGLVGLAVLALALLLQRRRIRR